MAQAPSRLIGLTLERVVMVERHGVRSPTKSPEALAPYAAEPWPAWPVAPGELTPHGRAGVVLMGQYLRARYAAAGLWPLHGCPGKAGVFVWADGHDERTRDSGQALLDGLFPTCGLVAGHGPDGALDPLFDAVETGVCPIDSEVARRAVLKAVSSGDLDRPGKGYEASLKALSAVLAPSGGVRGLPPPPNRIEGAGDPKIKGPLGVGATMAENLYLEYAQGFPAELIGWGRAGREVQIAALMPIHDIDADLMRRTAALAAPRGDLLAREVLDAIEGRTNKTFPQERPAPASARLVVIAGHDTNLSNLGGILGLDWTLPDQPDKTPPGGALMFEVWRGSDGVRYVRALFISQTLDQLRSLSPLTLEHAPGLLSLPLPCKHDARTLCSIGEFGDRLRQALPKTCQGG